MHHEHFPAQLWSLVQERPRPAPNPQSAGLTVEVLEDRCVMSTLSPHAAILPNLPGAVEQSSSTVPANGDGNPYGVAFVPRDFEGAGVLKSGDVLVSNFNSNSGIQGTGLTIERITPNGQVSTFFTSSLPGLDTALGVLKDGFVIVGNLPNVRRWRDGRPRGAANPRCQWQRCRHLDGLQAARWPLGLDDR